uniref:Putative secreted protein n=1 Tax=Ixodes ricinus TaxID=34613 RepID=A0A6B0UPW7_IXORI
MRSVTITYTASLALSKFSTLIAAAMSDCYQEMLEAVHFDCAPLATSSSDDELRTNSPWSPSFGDISQVHAGLKVNGVGAIARIAFGLPSCVSGFFRTAARRAWAIMGAPKMRERSWSRGLWTPWCD